MKYFVMCPANITSGGPELAHQLCHEITVNGGEAVMYYTIGNHSEPQNCECAERYKRYETTSAKTFEEADDENSIIVIPEGLTDWAFIFKKAKIVLWWMSVDNFSKMDDHDYFRGLCMITDIHLVQSEYARQYLIYNGVEDKNINWLSDYIGDAYGQFIFPAEYRKDIVLFNPKKGPENLVPLIRMCDFVEWKALYNMTEEQMILNMQLAKVYIDFGGHPGKDRIPREAASCGCCVITNRKGSANNNIDVPIDEQYKFAEPYDYEEIKQLIMDITKNYSSHLANFNVYRDMIKMEKEKFAKDVKVFLTRTENM